MGADQTKLESTARKCETTGQSLAQGMGQLIGKIEDLGSGRNMVGMSYQALLNESQHLDSGLRTILQALNELAGKMSDAAQKYGSAVDDASREIQAVGNMAGTNDLSISSLLRG
jgi:hypothetical protein